MHLPVVFEQPLFLFLDLRGMAPPAAAQLFDVLNRWSGMDGELAGREEASSATAV